MPNEVTGLRSTVISYQIKEDQNTKGSRTLFNHTMQNRKQIFEENLFRATNITSHKQTIKEMKLLIFWPVELNPEVRSVF